MNIKYEVGQDMYTFGSDNSDNDRGVFIFSKILKVRIVEIRIEEHLDEMATDVGHSTPGGPVDLVYIARKVGRGRGGNQLYCREEMLSPTVSGLRQSALLELEESYRKAVRKIETLSEADFAAGEANG